MTKQSGYATKQTGYFWTKQLGLNNVVNDRIARIAQGKSVVHVQAAELSKIEITYPDPFSQKTIIAILAAISDRIDQSNAELRLLHELRKALLQKLFI